MGRGATDAKLSRMRNMGRREFVKACAATLIAQISIWTDSMACDKKGHDCRVKTGRNTIRDLPCRVADQKGFFAEQRTHPDIAFGQDSDRLSSVIDGSSLIALASPLELPRLTALEKRIHIAAVLQVKPSLFLVTKKSAPDFRVFKGMSIGLTDSGVDRAYALLAFSNAKLRPKVDFGVTFIQSSADRLDALQYGRIAAGVFEAPTAFAAQDKGLITTPMLNYVPVLADTIIVGRQDQMDAEAKGLTGILAALQAAVQWINNPEHRLATIAMLQKEYNLPDDKFAIFVYDSLVRQRIYSTDLKLTPALTTTTNNWLAAVDVTQHWNLFDGRYLPRHQ